MNRRQMAKKSVVGALALLFGKKPTETPIVFARYIGPRTCTEDPEPNGVVGDSMKGWHQIPEYFLPTLRANAKVWEFRHYVMV